MSIIVEQTWDYDELDSVLRDPEVFERQAHTGCDIETITVKSLLGQSENNFFLRASIDGSIMGFWVLLQKMPGFYEVHTNFLPEFRGKEAMTAGDAGIDWMFLRTDCVKLASICPSCIPESALYARRCGFRQDHAIRPGLRFHDSKGGIHDSLIMSITLAEWFRNRQEKWADIGDKKFHKQLFGKAGFDFHEPDVNHDGVVGLCFMMAVEGGNPVKAQALYNSWAAFSGYDPIEFYGQKNGLIHVNIGNANITIDKNYNIEVLNLCQQQQPSLEQQPQSRER